MTLFGFSIPIGPCAVPLRVSNHSSPSAVPLRVSVHEPLPPAAEALAAPPAVEIAAAADPGDAAPPRRPRGRPLGAFLARVQKQPLLLGQTQSRLLRERNKVSSLGALVTPPFAMQTSRLAFGFNQSYGSPACSSRDVLVDGIVTQSNTVRRTDTERQAA